MIGFILDQYNFSFFYLPVWQCASSVVFEWAKIELTFLLQFLYNKTVFQDVKNEMWVYLLLDNKPKQAEINRKIILRHTF